MRKNRLLLAATVTVVTAGLPSTASAAESAEPQWQPVQTLSGSSDGGSPEIDVNPRGDAVATWLGLDDDDQRVFTAYRPAGGSWGAASAISPTGEDVTVHDVAIDDAGTATAMWRAEDSPDRLRTAVRSASGSWSSPSTLSAADAAVAGGLIETDAAGTTVVVWFQHQGGQGQLMTASRPRGAGWSSPIVLARSEGDRRFLDPWDLVYDGAGNFTLAYTQVLDGNQGRIMTVTGNPAASWQSPVVLASGDADTSLPRLAAADNGTVVAAWHQSVDGVVRAHAATRPTGGSWSEPRILSMDGSRTDAADVAVNSAGQAAAVWRVRGADSDDLEIQAANLGEDGTWSRPVTLSNVDRTAQDPRVVIDTNGNATAVWRDYAFEDYRNSRMQGAHQRAGDGWQPRATIAEHVGAAPEPVLNVDAYGNVLAAWRNWGWLLPDVTQAADLKAGAPATTMTQPSVTRQTATSFTAAWSVADHWNPVASTDVRYRVAPWNGAFGDSTAWLTDVTDRQANFAGTAGKTYCFSARARDSANSVGPWSGDRCTATPVDDVSLVRSSSTAWNRGQNSSYYLGTYTSTKTKGVSLTRSGVRAKHLSLLVTTCSSCGEVKASFNGATLGTFSLTSSTAVRKKLISLKTFDSVQTGTLKIQVVSPTGRTVYIDGVVARQS